MASQRLATSYARALQRNLLSLPPGLNRRRLVVGVALALNQVASLAAVHFQVAELSRPPRLAPGLEFAKLCFGTVQREDKAPDFPLITSTAKTQDTRSVCVVCPANGRLITSHTSKILATVGSFTRSRVAIKRAINSTRSLARQLRERLALLLHAKNWLTWY